MDEMLRDLLILITAAGWLWLTRRAWKTRKLDTAYQGAAFQTWLFLGGWMYAVQNLLLIWDPWRNIEHGPLLFSIWTRLAQAVFIAIGLASTVLAVRGANSAQDGGK